jgi:MFS family permease
VLQNFDKGRGLALGVVAACTGLGMAVIPVLDSWMITHFGWRQAYAMCGGLIFVGAIVNVGVLRGVSSTQSGAALPATHAVDQSLAVVLKESFGTLRKD